MYLVVLFLMKRSFDFKNGCLSFKWDGKDAGE